MSDTWAPRLTIGGLLQAGSLGCAITLLVTQFEFLSGRVRTMSGHAIGKCPGTVGGQFWLQRFF